MKRLGLLLALLMVAAPASAHRLKLFAALEGETISGFAFFVGAGRAQGATISVKDADGREIATLTADAEGAYRYKTPAPQTYLLTAATGDGHSADATINAARFAGASAPEQAGGDIADAPMPALTQAQIERAVDAALARQLRPLIEAYEAAEGRTRFNDIMGGIGMIIGLAGLALWASARRKDGKA